MTASVPAVIFAIGSMPNDPLVKSVSAVVIAITVVFMVLLDRLYGLDKLLSGRGKD